MDACITSRKERLALLLDWAQAYTGWTQAELASALGRHRTRLVPEGDPNLRFVVDLSSLLDLSVGELAEFIWIDASDDDIDGDSQDVDFDKIYNDAKIALRDGNSSLTIQLAEKAYHLAAQPDQRALACNVQAAGWDATGRHTRVMAAVQRGMQEAPIDPKVRRLLLSALASAYYTLWRLYEGKAIASELLEECGEAPSDAMERVSRAHAYFVRGNSLRRMVGQGVESGADKARQALLDLRMSHDLYMDLSEEFRLDTYDGIAHTCTGAIVELQVASGEISAEEGIDRMLSGLDAVVDPQTWQLGDMLESYGWWCIFGCDIAVRYLDDERLVQRHMAVFTNKAEEIADRLGNWAMRERVLSMEYARRQRLVEWGMPLSDWPIDRDDVRTIVGTIGRFPTFRDAGWNILRHARLVRAG